MTASNTHSRDAIADDAADWFVANRGEALDRRGRAAFMAWLKASPVHVELYLRIAAIARDLPAAVEDPSVDVDALLAQASGETANVLPIDQHVRHREAPRRAVQPLPHWRRAAGAALLALVAATAMCAAVWSTRDGERFGLPKTYNTARAEQRVQQLPDGSVLHLNTDSEVTVRYSRAERVVNLNRGQAYFEVAHAGARRFRVEAGRAGIVAVGTQFDVYRKPGAVVVTVLEGSVAVFAGGTVPPSPAGPLAANSTRLDAGYQLQVNDRIGAPQRVDTRAAVAWLARQIDFENEPLGQVVAEFNRYSHVEIEIDDEAIRALPVSGVFGAYDTDSFTTFLETLQGVMVQKTPTRIRVRSLASVNREQQAIAH
jgi:transmembrane sensor